MLLIKKTYSTWRKRRCASAGADGLSTLEAVVELQLTRELPTQLLAEAFRTNKCRGMSDSVEL